MASLLMRMKTVPIRYPFMFGMSLSTVKTSTSDLLVQTTLEQREKIDWRRNLAFASFGMFYLGGVQYMIYVPLFSRMFPQAASFAAKSIKEKMKDFRGMRNVGAQVFLDQCVHHPLMYFPAFYLTKEIVMKDNPDIKGTLMQYKENMREDLLALWKIWVPSTIVNFAFMPMWARIPWVAGTSLLWTVVLSYMRGGAITDPEDVAGGQVSGATYRLAITGVRELFACPVELDRNKSHFCLSANGPDKVGWVSKLSNTVAKNNGNVTHSKMVRLGDSLTIMMHVSVEPREMLALKQSLLNSTELRPLGIRIASLNRRLTKAASKPKVGVHIHCLGGDRPGMLAAISTRLAQESLSVENLTTELEIIDGERKFVVKAACTTSLDHTPDEIQTLRYSIGNLKEELNLDMMNIIVHRNAIIGEKD